MIPRIKWKSLFKNIAIKYFYLIFSIITVNVENVITTIIIFVVVFVSIFTFIVCVQREDFNKTKNNNFNLQ